MTQIINLKIGDRIKDIAGKEILIKSISIDKKDHRISYLNGLQAYSFGYVRLIERR